MAGPAAPLPALPSELTEPYFARTIGLLWDRFARSKRELEHYQALWHGVRAIDLLSTVACDSKQGTHASIACSNALGGLARFITAETGIDPLREWPA